MKFRELVSDAFEHHGAADGHSINVLRNARQFPDA